MNKVIWMNSALSAALRNKILLEIKEVAYEKTKDKPHNPGTEYFVCNECKIVIAFPLKTAQ